MFVSSPGNADRLLSCRNYRRLRRWSPQSQCGPGSASRTRCIGPSAMMRARSPYVGLFARPPLLARSRSAGTLGSSRSRQPRPSCCPDYMASSCRSSPGMLPDGRMRWRRFRRCPDCCQRSLGDARGDELLWPAPAPSRSLVDRLGCVPLAGSVRRRSRSAAAGTRLKPRALFPRLDPCRRRRMLRSPHRRGRGRQRSDRGFA